MNNIETSNSVEKPSGLGKRKFWKWGLVAGGLLAAGSIANHYRDEVVQVIGDGIDAELDLNDKVPRNFHVDSPLRRPCPPYAEKNMPSAPARKTLLEVSPKGKFLSISFPEDLPSLRTVHSRYSFELCNYDLVGETIITPGTGHGQEYAVIGKSHAKCPKIKGQKHILAIGYQTGNLYVQLEKEEWEPLTAKNGSFGLLGVKPHWEDFASQWQISGGPEDQVITRLLRRSNGIRIAQQYSAPYPFVEAGVEMPVTSITGTHSKNFSESAEDAVKWENRKNPFYAEKGRIILDPAHIMGSVIRTKRTVKLLRQLIDDKKTDRDNIVKIDGVFNFTYRIEKNRLNNNNLYQIAYGILLDNSVVSEAVSQSLPTELIPELFNKIEFGSGLSPEDLYSNQLGITEALRDLKAGREADHQKILARIVARYGVAAKPQLSASLPLGIFSFIPVVMEKGQEDRLPNPNIDFPPMSRGWEREHIACGEIVLKVLNNAQYAKSILVRIEKLLKELGG